MQTEKRGGALFLIGWQKKRHQDVTFELRPEGNEAAANYSDTRGGKCLRLDHHVKKTRGRFTWSRVGQEDSNRRHHLGRHSVLTATKNY